MKTKIYLLIFLCFYPVIILSKILIITHAFNRPDFIEIQYKTFKKFLLDEYEFVVFNDANNRKYCNQIESMCQKYNIDCIRIPQEIHGRPYLKRWPGDHCQNPSVRTSNAIQYSLNTMGFKHNGIVAIIDSDMFLIKKFSIKKYLDGYDLAGVHQSRSGNGSVVNYLWNGLVFFNMDTLPNKKTIDFNCGKVENLRVDTGGQTHHYIKNNPSVKIKHIPIIHTIAAFSCTNCKRKSRNCTHNSSFLKNKGFNQTLIAFIQSYSHPAMEFSMELLINDTFLHYRGGGNWMGKSSEYHKAKSRPLKKLIDNLLKIDL